jgi:uncharacterized DUF497 family protein
VVIVWDEAKRLSNLVKHGLDFASIEWSFDFERAIVLPAKPSKSGRLWLRIIGEMNSGLVALVASPLGAEALAIISLRPASKQERKFHES